MYLSLAAYFSVENGKIFEVIMDHLRKRQKHTTGHVSEVIFVQGWHVILEMQSPCLDRHI